MLGQADSVYCARLANDIPQITLIVVVYAVTTNDEDPFLLGGNVTELGGRGG